MVWVSIYLKPITAFPLLKMKSKVATLTWLTTTGQENQAAATQTQQSSAPAQPSAEVPEIDLSSMAAQFAQFAQAATKSAEETKSDADFTQCLADTLKQISENNEQLQVRSGQN